MLLHHSLGFLVAVLGMQACQSDESSIRPGGWGELVKIMDVPEYRQFDTPILERGALVYGKVVIGDVTISSSDESVFRVESADDVIVDPRCGTCTPDRDIQFTLLAIGEGDAELVVRASRRDKRRLKVRVAERATAEIVDGFDGRPLSEIVMNDRYVMDAGRLLELYVRDADGNLLATHTTWELDSITVAAFLEFEWHATYDVFSITEPNVHEGPQPILRGIEKGETTLRVSTTGGFAANIPVRAGDSENGS